MRTHSPLAPNLQELGQIQKKQPEGITAGPKGEDMLVWEGAITGEVCTMPPRLLDRDVTRRSPQSDLDAAAVAQAAAPAPGRSMARANHSPAEAGSERGQCY